LVFWHFLLGFLLFFFTAYKSGRHVNNPSKEWGVVFWVITFLPIVTFFLSINYYYLIAIAAPFLIRYFYSEPAMAENRQELNLTYKSLSLTNEDSRFSFSPNQSTVVFNGDSESYIDWIWPLVTLNRVCKNTYGEYFWVHQDQYLGVVTIKHITVEAAKNLIRPDRGAFINEFGAEPYT
jgi:hypothetical protein